MTAGIRVSVTQPSAPASMEHTTQGCHLVFFDFLKHEQSSYFCRGPDDFCWGPAPVGPTLVTGSHISQYNTGPMPGLTRQEVNRNSNWMTYHYGQISVLHYISDTKIAWMHHVLYCADRPTRDYLSQNE